MLSCALFAFLFSLMVAFSGVDSSDFLKVLNLSLFAFYLTVALAFILTLTIAVLERTTSFFSLAQPSIVFLRSSEEQTCKSPRRRILRGRRHKQRVLDLDQQEEVTDDMEIDYYDLESCAPTYVSDVIETHTVHQTAPAPPIPSHLFEDINTSSTTSLSVVAEDSFEDIDRGEPTEDVTYISDIINRLRFLEQNGCVACPDYMEKKQFNISWGLRRVLVKRMIIISKEFELLPATLFLAVQIVDRFLSRTNLPVAKHDMKILGLAALLIASKHEETHGGPHIDDYIWIANDEYTKAQLIQAERIILETLNYKLMQPTAVHFLPRFFRASGSAPEIYEMSIHILELSLIERTTLRFLPSVVAASAICLSRVITKKRQKWNTTLERYTGYEESELRECVELLYELYLQHQQ